MTVQYKAAHISHNLSAEIECKHPYTNVCVSNTVRSVGYAARSQHLCPYHGITSSIAGLVHQPCH
jgi:hypothetical protein